MKKCGTKETYKIGETTRVLPYGMCFRTQKATGRTHGFAYYYISIVIYTAITYFVCAEDFVENLDNLPDEAHKA